MRKKKRVVVFGIFDGIHDGHRSLFRQAKERGDELIVIVGRDSASLKWKGKKPRYSEEERLSLVQEEQYVDNAVLGDEEQSTYRVLKSLGPDCICFGYDQEDLEQDLLVWMEKTDRTTEVVRLKPFLPEKYHTSLFKP